MHDDLPLGFKASAAACGFKQAGRNDLGLILSATPCVYAGLFTKNRFSAAPVKICQDLLAQNKRVRAIVANSGQANACTGTVGLSNAKACQEMIAASFDCESDEVLPISTGVIGTQLKLDLWQQGLPMLKENLGKLYAEGFTRAMMTTDAFPKFSTHDLTLSKGKVRLTVMAKGAGMICPNMATMLCVCLTDAQVEPTVWQEMFSQAVAQTFNRVSVDGDTSTNDTILGLANGASSVPLATESDVKLFSNNLTAILARVAHMLVMDGEGAHKVIHITVTGAIDEKNAAIVARSVGNSQLVKTAIYGGDANWGRIITAVGYSGASYDPETVSLKLCGIERFNHGQPVNDDQEEALAKLLQAKDVFVEISLGQGAGSYTLETSDLGHEYVTLNSDYRS